MVPKPITWERLRRIFGNPKPVTRVTQKQFDYCDEALQRLGQTPYEAIDFGDLWYYHHDLAYVDLQPDLFAYLFPVCLMDWHLTLSANEPCSHGDSEFHNGIIKGDIWSKMLTERQRIEIGLVFRDSMLNRLDAERGFVYNGSATPAYGWIGRLNSLGLFWPSLPTLWETWWEAESFGRAVSLLQYCSGLMYFPDDNPLFGTWTKETGGGSPGLWANDSLVHDRGWTDSNAAFIADFLTVERVQSAVRRAADKLHDQPECRIAEKLADDFNECKELVASRVSELPVLLKANTSDEWSV